MKCSNGPGADGCAVAHAESHTFEYSVNGGLNLGNFFSGGFAVTQSFTSGNTYECQAKPGTSVCVWIELAHVSLPILHQID
jgi:hypothetical protein